jgi:dihydroorotate dehydrogenase
MKTPIPVPLLLLLTAASSLAADAYRKLRLGASLVQIYTALIYEGPGVIAKINRGLCSLLLKDGFRNVNEAVGADLHHA